MTHATLWDAVDHTIHGVFDDNNAGYFPIHLVINSLTTTLRTPDFPEVTLEFSEDAWPLMLPDLLTNDLSNGLRVDVLVSSVWFVPPRLAA